MKKFYITTSIPYVNAPPHIGFALESIQADVLARYNRSLKKDVFFLTGTDEHGIKVAKTARKEGKEPEEFAKEISSRFQLLKEALNLSNDDFIRTTDQKRHKPTVEKVWEKLKENGDIYKKKYKGLYCQGCEAFLTKKDLVNGKCAIHQLKPDIVKEENYFFKLTKYLPQIKKIIKEDKLQIIPQSRKNEVMGVINQGIEDVSFSRSKEKYWGFSVPEDKSQLIYVWPDALSNYISALDYSGDQKKFKKYWPADVHCIGKDIIKFHCLYWPAILLSLKIALPKKIFVHGFITVNSQKMSKSLGNIIDPFELSQKYGKDSLRYYLLREIPSTEDGDFSYEKFKQRHNSDLSGGIGNLVSRTATMAKKLSIKIQAPSLIIRKEVKNCQKNYQECLSNFKFNEALKTIWDLITFCDRYISSERPWENNKNSLKVISDLVFSLENIAVFLEPFLPDSSKKILKEIETDKKTKLLKKKEKEAIFPRI